MKGMSGRGGRVAEMVQSASAQSSPFTARSGLVFMHTLLAVQDLLMGLLLTLPHAAAAAAAASAAAHSKQTEDPVDLNAVVLASSVLGALGLERVPLASAVLAALKSLAMFGLVIALSMLLAHRGIPAAVRLLGGRRRHEDTRLLALVALCMVMALVTEEAGLSLEVGALFAGLAVAGSRTLRSAAQSLDPVAKVFSALYFASVGLVVSPVFVLQHLPLLLAVLAFVVGLRAALVMLLARTAAGVPLRAAVGAAAVLSATSEFALVFTSKAHALGILSRRAYLLGLITTVGSLVSSPILARGLEASCVRKATAGGPVREHDHQSDEDRDDADNGARNGPRNDRNSSAPVGDGATAAHIVDDVETAAHFVGRGGFRGRRPETHANAHPAVDVGIDDDDLADAPLPSFARTVWDSFIEQRRR